jgi:hypothetical protein
MYIRILPICTVLLLAFSAGNFARAGNMDMPTSGGKPMPPDAPDMRVVIPLTEAEQALVMANMRQMLGSVEGVTDALARGDSKAVAEAASRSGMAMMQKVPMQIRMKFPPPFAQMGMASHKPFDQIAREAETAKGPAPILELLSESIRNCNACHASYRFAPPK